MAFDLQNEHDVQTTRQSAPLHDDIARRAYEIWEAAGRPEGMDADHWNQAERELMNGSTNGTKEPIASDFASAGRPRSPERAQERASAAGLRADLPALSEPDIKSRRRARK